MKKLVIFPALAIFILSACGSQNVQKAGGAPAPSGPTINLSITGESNTPVAEINGVPITEKELNQQIASRLTRIKSQVFDIQRQGINNIINDRLLQDAAKKEGTTVQALIKQKVNDKVGEITDKEMEEFYESNKRRFRGKPFDEVKNNVKRQLYARKSAVYRNNFLDQLKKKADIKIFLTRPSIDVSPDDDPSIGEKGAPITIIEFTDYQCPFCRRARPTIHKILDDYKGKIFYVQRDFPLGFHANAKKAAEAAQCAGEQDKYFDYSEKLWENQRALDIASLKKYAQETGLNQEKFDKCLDSGKFSQEVEKDMADGTKAGVTGTPSFFINGQMLTGARPYEQFKEIIDMELMTANGKS